MRVTKQGGNRLKADVLGPGFRATVRILDVREERCGSDMKPVMYFHGHDKGLALNATNIDTLVALFNTDESEFWIGRSVEVYTTMTTFQGKQTLGIRLRAPSSGAPPPPPPAAPRAREPGDDDGPITGPMSHTHIKW